MMLPWIPLLLPNLAYALLVWRLGSVLADGRTLLRPLNTGREPLDPTPSRVSVIITARNEERSLPDTLAALADQDLDPASWELIVVDDQSCDATIRVIEPALAVLGRKGVGLQLLATSPDNCGKKAALDLGVRSARHDLVAVLDADCRPGPGWLRAMISAVEPGTGLVAGPVVFSGRGLFAALIRLEYAGLVGAGLASFALGRPLFASGANLCYLRQAYLDAGGYQGLMQVRSADDTLLIQRLHGLHTWRLTALLKVDGLVATRAPQGLRAFWRQRVRWTSGERHFPDKQALAAAVALYVVFCGTALGLAGVVAGIVPVLPALGLVLLKLVPDTRLVWHAAKRLESRRIFHLLPLVWLGQLAYGLVVPWFGTFGQFKWRENE